MYTHTDKHTHTHTVRPFLHDHSINNNAERDKMLFRLCINNCTHKHTHTHTETPSNTNTPNVYSLMKIVRISKYLHWTLAVPAQAKGSNPGKKGVVLPSIQEPWLDTSKRGRGGIPRASIQSNILSNAH